MTGSNSTDPYDFGHCDDCRVHLESFEDVGYLGVPGPQKDVECTPMTMLAQYCRPCAEKRGFLRDD